MFFHTWSIDAATNKLLLFNSFRRQHEQLCQVIVRVLRFAAPTTVRADGDDNEAVIENIETADSSAVQVENFCRVNSFTLLRQ